MISIAVGIFANKTIFVKTETRMLKIDHGAVWSISITVVCMLFKVGESETRSSTCTNPPRYRESMQQPKYPTLTEG